MKSLRFLFVSAALTLWSLGKGLPLEAYDLITHVQISQRAVDSSAKVRSYFDDVGIKPTDVFDPDGNARQGTAFSGFENTGTLRDWLAAGAIREDDFQPHINCDQPQNPPSDIDRPLHHFFDVQRGGGGLTVAGSERGFPAPDWALGRQGRGRWYVKEM